MRTSGNIAKTSEGIFSSHIQSGDTHKSLKFKTRCKSITGQRINLYIDHIGQTGQSVIRTGQQNEAGKMDVFR